MTNDNNDNADDSIDSELPAPTGLDDKEKATLDEAQRLLRKYYTSVETVSSHLEENNPEAREDCFFTSREEDTLFDAWQMLKYYGGDDDVLETLARVIKAGTIYNKENLNQYYTNVVLATED